MHELLPKEFVLSDILINGDGWLAWVRVPSSLSHSIVSWSSRQAESETYKDHEINCTTFQMVTGVLTMSRQAIRHGGHQPLQVVSWKFTVLRIVRYWVLKAKSFIFRLTKNDFSVENMGGSYAVQWAGSHLQWRLRCSSFPELWMF